MDNEGVADESLGVASDFSGVAEGVSAWPLFF